MIHKTIHSSNDNDTRKMIVRGYDMDWNITSQVIKLDGNKEIPLQIPLKELVSMYPEEDSRNFDFTQLNMNRNVITLEDMLNII